MRFLESEPLLTLIGRIYDAALDADLWPEVVQRVVDVFDARSAMLFTSMHTPDQGGFVFPANLPENFLQRWASRYVQHDVWNHAGVSKGLYVEGRILTDEELVPHIDFLQSLIWREFLHEFDIARLCCGIVFGADANRNLPTVLSMFRGVGDLPFGAQERRLHGIVVPHVSRALGIMFRLRDAELKVAATRAALDRLSAGVLLLGPRRAVVFANRAARTLLDGSDGLRLRFAPPGISLIAAERIEDQRVLDAAIDLCLNPLALEVPHFARAVRVRRVRGPGEIIINCSALPEQNEFGTGADRPRAIAFLADATAPVSLDENLLRSLYGLTAAECRLAAKVCEGGKLESIAAFLGVSENTAKTQLKSIFEKTGTHRQVQLVRLLLSLHSNAVR